ncbi:hypothetical protein CGCFRS4_v015799 [Colletotrichum fructicola]|nr:hypothetical protein CFRS1_v015134 [Colletotrichum fructicola]KAF4881199.1 hypothetical protein CGCFRS4_v015799 [Colletotrichum fructicola]
MLPKWMSRLQGDRVIASSISEQTSMLEQTSSTSKKRKRRSSLRRQSNLITIQNAMNHRSFDGEIAPSPALGHLLDAIETLPMGIGIVSRATEASVRAELEASTSCQFHWVRDETFARDPVVHGKPLDIPLEDDDFECFACRVVQQRKSFLSTRHPADPPTIRW